jgi:3-oxoacyl-[acyl-carrier protein] reductase
MPPGRLDEYLEHIPLRRIGQPEEVADAVLFLLSAQSRYITGASLVIDGGMTC